LFLSSTPPSTTPTSPLPLHDPLPISSYNLLRHFSIPPDNLRTAKPPRKSTGRKTRHYSLQTTTCANRQPWPRRSASPGSPPREGSGTLHLQSLFPYRCTCQRERGRQP